MLAHLIQHFRDEEALLAQHGYRRLADHTHAHAALLRQAAEVKAAVERGEATLGHLVNFLVYDVIALHVLKSDRDFSLLLRTGNGAVADRARGETGMRSLRAH
jgi:hemerythrin-like metal-binding protein